MSHNSDSEICQEKARSPSPESKHSAESSSRAMDSPVPVPGSPPSLIQSCEPDASDTSQLAELPEPLPPEQVESCQDSGGDPQETGSITNISCENGNKNSDVLEYVDSSDGNQWHDELPYTSAPLDASSSVSQSYVDYNIGPGQNSEPLQHISKEPLFKVPTRKEASDFHGVLPPVFPYACVLCNITVLTEKVWLWHVRGARHSHNQLELLKKYPEWDQNIESAKRNESQATLPATFTKTRVDRFPNVPTRKEAADFQGRVPPVFPDECFLCNFTAFSEEEWSEHTSSALHAKSQLDLVERYPGWDQTIESTKRNERPSRGRFFVKSDPIFKVPTRKEASDFHGKVPPVFPNECVLCDTNVHSERGWSVHISGARHASCQGRLLEKYPDWDQSIRSARRNEIQVTPPAIFPNRRGEFPQECQRKYTSNLGRTSSMKTSEKDHGRVVCVTFDAHAVKEGYLKRLLGEFGEIVKFTMFPTMALVEMGSKDQSADIVKYYSRYPLEVHGKQIEFSLSTKTSLLEISRVVSFTPLPAGEGTTSELMAVAKRFGSVKNSLFLPGRGYVEMSDLDEAKKMVEHFSTKALKLKKKTIQVTFSSEFDTLIATQVEGKTQSQRSPLRRSSSRGRHSSESGSPSPKRRRSSERTYSPRSSCSKEREDRHHSRERSVSNDQVGTLDSDSDLEGLEVIADDEEEFLRYDDDETTDDQVMDQEQKTCEEIAQLDSQPARSSASTPNQNTATGGEVKRSNNKSQENLASGRVDVLEGALKIDRSKSSSIFKKSQKPKHQKDEDLETEEEDIDFPESLENCITLDELEEESSSDYEELNTRNSSAQKTESTEDDVTETMSLPVHESYMDSTDNTKQSKSPKESTNSTAEIKSLEEESIQTTTDHCTEKPNIEKERNGIKEVFGKVLDVRNLPKAEEFTDLDFVNVAKRYGEVKHYMLIHHRKRGFIAMTHTSDAERIAADSKNQDIALRGCILKIKVSEKYSSLPTAGFNGDSDDEESSKRENSRDFTDNQSVALPELTAEPLNEPQRLNEPVGTEFVNPVMGYICNLCNVIYASEEEARDKHCRSQSHHEKLKEHHEKMHQHEDLVEIK